MSGACLSVNLNKIALIRNSRPGDFPNLLIFAHRCIAAGADGITVHPRPDQRHVRAADCPVLAAAIEVEFNIEGNPFAGAAASTRADVGDYPGFMALVEAVRPAQCTLVPDASAQLTSDHGFDLERDARRLAPIIHRLRDQGTRVSLFMDPAPAQIRRAADLGADRVELFTGPWAQAWARGENVDAVLDDYRRAAETAAECNLGLNAGHDLNLENLPRFATLRGLREVSIGHALVVDALLMGLDAAIAAYRRCLK